MQVDKIVNVKLSVGDVVQIEHTSVDERKKIKATVACANINQGKGIAIFCDEDGKTYSWKPYPSPHGEVTRIDCAREDVLINPYVMAFSKEVQKFRPVDAYSGEYYYTEKVCETHEWSIALPPHGDHICRNCKMVVNDNFQEVGYYGN